MHFDFFTTLVVDRSLSITFPVWHHTKNWQKLNPKISRTITIFYAITTIEAFFAVHIENHACVSRENWFLKVYRLIYAGFFLAGTHFLLLLISSVTFILQLNNHHKSKVSPRQQNSTIRMNHLNMCPVRATPDNQLENTTLDGNNENSANLDATQTVAATANPVFDRAFLTILCKLSLF